MTDEKTFYRETTPWPTWAAAIYWGAMLGTAAMLLSGVDTDLPTAVRITVAAAIVTGAWVLRSIIRGLTVLVQESRLFLHLGSWPVIRRTVPFAEILDLESVTYRPIAEFGGWGVRGVGKRKAWTARGDRAVRLTLADERVLYVGSDNPQRLEERIRTAAGDRLGRSAVGDHARPE